MVSSLEKSLGQANAVWEWLKRPHTLLWSFLAFCVCWAFTTGPTAALATLALWSLASTVRFALWRHHWLNELAAAGQPPPGIWKLRKQIKVAQRRKNLILSRWDLACINQEKLQGKRRGIKDKKVPPLTNMRLKVDGNVSATVDMGAIGKSIEHLMGVKREIGNVCKAQDLMVYQRTPGVADVTFIYTDPLHTILTFQEMPLPERRRTPQFSIGNDEFGRVMQLPLMKPTLIVGEQGSGKSVAAEAILGSLFMQDIYVLLFCVDPKNGQEWSRLEALAGSGEWSGHLKVARYAANAEDGKDVIKAARRYAANRAVELAREGIRNFSGPYTMERPLVLLAIDELMSMVSELRKEDSDLKEYLRTARAGGGTMLGMAQYAHSSAMETSKSLFGNRLLFRAPTTTAVTVFGPDAVSAGADSKRISTETPGVGFYQSDEDTSSYIRFRAAHVTDPVVDLILSGELPHDMGLGRVTELQYTHWCYIIPNRLGECIYLGETERDPDERLKEHLVKPWGPEIDVANVRRIPVHGPTKAAAKDKALKLEAKLTKELKPLYPSEHNMDNPHRLDWRRGQLASERPALKAGSGATVVRLDDHRPAQPTLVEVEPDDDAEPEQAEVSSGNGWGLKRPW